MGFDPPDHLPTDHMAGVAILPGAILLEAVVVLQGSVENVVSSPFLTSLCARHVFQKLSRTQNSKNKMLWVLLSKWYRIRFKSLLPLSYFNSF